jgi:putative ABC transport system permease protein
MMNLALPTLLIAADSSRGIWIAGAAALVVVVGLILGVKVPLKYLVRNLTVRWRTTLMTALAFVLVISLLTVMMAFVNGMYRLTQASGQPGNVMVLADGATDESFSNLVAPDMADLENQPGILRENGHPLCSRETYLVVTQPIENPVPGRPQRRFLQVRGLDDSAMSGRVHGLELYPGGSWLSEAGVRELEPNEPATGGAPAQPLIEAVLGEGVAHVLAGEKKHSAGSAPAPARLDVGDTFTLGDRKWIAVGILKSAGSTFDSEIWAKRGMIGPMFGKDTYSSLVLRTAGPTEAKNLKNYFNSDYKKAAVLAQVETDYFDSLSGTNRQFLFAIGFVTVVMAVGGVMGVMNTMFAAVSNRVKDIGVLRLMGYSRSQIMLAFLLESLFIAMIGGAIGCALGSLVDGWTASSIISNGPGGGKSVVLQLSIDLQTLLLGFVLAMAMGVLGGFLPAFSAVRLKPLEALR